MIVKIWPIKAVYSGEKGKVGGWQGVKNAQKYIEDGEKVIAAQEDLFEFELDGTVNIENNPFINNEKDFRRSISYIANEDKTEAKYISKYLCMDDDVSKDFQLAAEKIAFLSKGRAKLDRGAMAFHIVQSFPAGLDISDEEVHQCGIDLVKRLKKHQAVICSHVHPVIGKDGELHGKAKHNHIIINAFIHPNFYDPEKGGQRKYHDCKDSYKQLQIFNDEIAIEHGLPIIRVPEEDRGYSWYENEKKNHGQSWKQSVRFDIEKFRRVAKNWDQFVRIMKMEGYEVVEKAHTTYVTPEGNRVRGNTLGRQYTKEALNLYWAARDHQRSMFQMDLLENEGFGISDIVYQSKEKLTIKIPLGTENAEEQNCYLLPFDKNIKANTDALYTYLRANQTYDICTEDGEPVTSASGHEIVQSIEDLRDESLMILRREKLLSDKGLQEKRRLRKEKEVAEKERIYYENEKFRNRRTGQPYRVSVYDEDGRPRSTIELVFILALVILDKEELLWEPPEHYPEQENEIFFASTNWKIQYLVDAIELAREEALETPAQLDKRLDIVGADLSRTKYAIKAVTEAKEKMDRVAETIADYNGSKALAESIMELPEDEERYKMESRYAHVLEDYQKTRQRLEKFRIMDDAGIRDFERRYEKIQQDIAGLEERKAAQSEHYRRLKKLEYSLQLAEDPRYLYGLDHAAHGKNNGKKKSSKQERY